MRKITTITFNYLPSPPESGAKYCHSVMSISMCLFVCSHNLETTRSNFTMLYISGFWIVSCLRIVGPVASDDVTSGLAPVRLATRVYF